MPIDVVGGIAAARHGAELLKTLRAALTDPEIDHAEVINRLIEIQGLILDAQAGGQGPQIEMVAHKRVARISEHFNSTHDVYSLQGLPCRLACWAVVRKTVSAYLSCFQQPC